MSASFEFGPIQKYISINMYHKKNNNNFAEIFKNLIRSKNNFVGPLK